MISTDYTSFRNEFLSKAALSGLSHLSIQHALQGPDQEPLFTDYVFSPEKKKKVLIHLSGVHGVEGYIGSLIQSEILSKIKFQNPNYQTVFVHAVNPYGMAWYHRTNAENVDLNRNGLKDFNLSNPYYGHFKKILTSTRPVAMIWELIKLLPIIFQLGIPETVKTVASGQSQYPDSLFYTGKNLQPELQTLIKTLKSLISDDCEIYVLDVHSGLGKLADELLIVDSREEETTVFFENCFQKKIFDPSKEKNAYPAHGGMPSLLKQHWPSEKIFHVFQEFGTRNFITVILTLVKQTAFICAKDHSNPVALENLKKIMLHSFFPFENEWREKCKNNGVLRYDQIKNFLIDELRK